MSNGFKKWGKLAAIIGGGLLGAIVYWIVFGPGILYPTNIGWTMEGDSAQHLLGWSFFRNDPWTWPLGKITSLNYPEGTSIVYTDSLPLFALFFKLFEGYLPEPFQYRGIWVAFCYVMTGVSSALLIRRVTNSWLFVVFGSLFLLINPVILIRTLGHYTLAGQWLIILALYLYLKPSNYGTKIRWTLLCGVASLVHFYLLLMVLALFGAFLLRVFKWEGRCSLYKQLVYPSINMLLLIFTHQFHKNVSIP
tara:strand:- start:10 stop:759 length:750 start_codon:yes stop_codon:yes gene_type:complete